MLSGHLHSFILVHLVPKLLLGNAQRLVKLQLQPLRQSLRK